MKNQPLIQEVISQDLATVQPQDPRYQGLFRLLPSLLKAQNSLHCWTQAIDTLLEKEYIERVDGHARFVRLRCIECTVSWSHLFAVSACFVALFPDRYLGYVL